MTKQIDTLLQKEMTRKEFLSLSLLAVGSLFGLSGIIKLLTGHTFEQRGSGQRHGYGSSAYGE